MLARSQETRDIGDDRGPDVMEERNLGDEIPGSKKLAAPRFLGEARCEDAGPQSKDDDAAHHHDAAQHPPERRYRNDIAIAGGRQGHDRPPQRGDVVPITPLGRMLGGVVMMSGIIVFALWAGILATGFAEETRRREFLRTWDLVAKVPFFHDIGASIIADVARLLRPREYPAGAVIFRRGEHGDCMYFIASGEVEIRLAPDPIYLGAGQFFGEIALLTGGPRTATVVAACASTLLLLDIADFRDLVGRQPDLARIINEEAERRLVPAVE